jgi:hypothetical protein
MAGLKGLRSGWSRSKATTVQQVVSTHMAATESGGDDDDLAFAAASAPRTATPSARHQSDGFCSARAGAGNVVGYGSEQKPRALPV